MKNNKRAHLERLRTAISNKLIAKSSHPRITIGDVRARNHRNPMKFTKELFAFEIKLHNKNTGSVALREGYRGLEFYLRDEGAGVGELQPKFSKSGSGGFEPRPINFASARDIERVAQRFVKYMSKMREKPRGYV